LKDNTGEFQHYMLKEIFEQPEAILQTIESLAVPPTLLDEVVRWPARELEPIRRILIAASGSSRHAGIAGKIMIEALTRIPVEVAFSSELQYAPATAGAETLVIVITQSGETADTLGALRAVKKNGARVLAISNVADSQIMREADAGIHTKAGPELAIPSTKSFSAQLAALFAVAMWLAARRGASPADTAARAQALRDIPEKVKKTLDVSPQCQALAQRYAWCQDFFFAGRGVHYAIALDGALKLKEASYIHAEAFPAGEILHGPLALVDSSITLVLIATRDTSDTDSMQRYDRSLALLRQVKERSAKIIVVANEPEAALVRLADDLVEVPSASELLLPLIEIAPLQLFAYYTAAVHGRDVDRPRNLTKAVITE
jgi:glucosamine--fructose-6-phosphate aminotransferase (isomerizing)